VAIEISYLFRNTGWLFNITKLENICLDFVCFTTSAMNDVVSNRLPVGRPFGGVAIVVKQNLATEFKVVKLSSRYIILKAWSTLFINVYLPCISAADWENEYLDCLACILNDIGDITYKNIVMGGDFNIDFATSHPLSDSLCDFMADLSLLNLDNKLPSNATCSFRVDVSGASSLVDHFFVSESTVDSVSAVDIVDSGINLSDHCAVVMDMLLPVENHITYTRNSKVSASKYSYRWDKVDLNKYYAASYEHLHAISVPVHLLRTDSMTADNNDSIQIDIEMTR